MSNGPRWTRLVPGTRRVSQRQALGLLGHREQVVARDLPDQIRMVAVDVRFRVRDQLVVGLAAHDLPALTVDQLRHQLLLQYVSTLSCSRTSSTSLPGIAFSAFPASSASWTPR